MKPSNSNHPLKELPVDNVMNKAKETRSKRASKRLSNNQDFGKGDYERMIDEKRKKRLAFLETLQLNEVKSSFCKAVSDLKPKKNPSDVKRPLRSTGQIRKSKRSDNIYAYYSYADVILKAIVDVKKEMPTPQKLPMVFPFERVLKKESISKFVQDFSGLECKTERRYKLVSHVKNMEVSPSLIANVLPREASSIAVHPACDKIVICAASSDGHVAFWNVNSGSNPCVFAPHKRNISKVMFNPYNSNNILSSSYDGALRCGDLEKQVFTEVCQLSNKISCNYFDVLNNTTFLVAQSSGHLALVDSRASKKFVENSAFQKYSQQSVSVHPLNKNYFISSDSRRIKLWDLRQLLEKPVSESEHHGQGGVCALFSPLTGNSVLFSSSDPVVCVWDSSNLSAGISLKKTIKHMNRKISSIKAIWVPHTDDTFAVGSVSFPKIKIFDDNGNNLHDFMIEDFAAAYAFHPNSPVFACGSDTGDVICFADIQ